MRLQGWSLVLALLERGLPGGGGLDDYSGPLLSDLVFADFSHAALVRIADEVCLQMHLLNLGFVRALAARGDAEQVRSISTRQPITAWRCSTRPIRTLARWWSWPSA